MDGVSIELLHNRLVFSRGDGLLVAPDAARAPVVVRLFDRLVRGFDGVREHVGQVWPRVLASLDAGDKLLGLVVFLGVFILHFFMDLDHTPREALRVHIIE